MAVSAEFVEHLLDSLAPLGPVAARRMMGGVTLYLGELTFGLVSDDVLYLKVGDDNIARFEAAGSGPFTYRRGSKEFAMKSHWRAPEDLLDDADELVAQARTSIDAARAAAKAKRTRKPKKPKKKQSA
jgi:DNA transformation protein